jgi:hypothetical protein
MLEERCTPATGVHLLGSALMQAYSGVGGTPPEESAGPGHLAQRQIPLGGDKEVSNAHKPLVSKVPHSLVNGVME